MTSDLDTGGESPLELRRRRTFRMRIWAGAGCFLLANFALYALGHGAGPWRLVWALLPLIPIVWIVVVIVLRVRQMDEYQTKLFFPGLAVAMASPVSSKLTRCALPRPVLPFIARTILSGLQILCRQISFDE